MPMRKLRAAFPTGHLTIVLPNGRQESLGDGAGPEIVIRVSSRLTALKIAANPQLRLGEAYMDGTLEFLKGDIGAFLELYGRNLEAMPPEAPGWLERARVWAARKIRQRNDRGRAQRNVAHHYNLSGALYRQFLDADMHYSCAYFPQADMSLEEAQRAKVRHIAGKLRLEPGKSVLDIGSGWGGLAMGLASNADVHVQGVTLSTEQLGEARQRAAARGLDHLVAFDLMDYRDVRGTFDRIVSVGMFEHVGAPNFDTFFQTVRDRLSEDGVALIHAIGRRMPPGDTNPWIDRYIFPGGYVPALSETLGAVERAGLWVTDVEILRLHYAETCRLWRERFHNNAALVRQIYDDRFFRMWDFYLAVSEVGFRHGGLMVFQLQLAKRVDTLPTTRDYMTTAERAVAGAVE